MTAAAATGGLKSPFATAWLPVLAWVGTAWLAGCATPPPGTTGGPFSLVSGRLSLQVAADTDRRAQNLAASFELQGDADAGELRLMSPLGTQLAAARWAPGSASLQTPSGTQVFDNLDALSRQALGEALPLAALPSWLAGKPWPMQPHQPRAQGFEQAGWQVLLARQTEGVIEARRVAPPAVLLRVRLDAQR